MPLCVKYSKYFDIPMHGYEIHESCTSWIEIHESTDISHTSQTYPQNIRYPFLLNILDNFSGILKGNNAG